jgi:glycosyltransferase involved in cell wall biosynthesis
VAVSAGVADSVRAGTRVRADQVVVLHNPVDVAGIRAAAAEPLEEGVDWLDDPARDAIAAAHLGPDDPTDPTDESDRDRERTPTAETGSDPAGTDGPLLFTVGRLEDAKDLPTLLRAFVEVRERLPTARLVVAGQGSRKDDLAALADELGIADSVRFPGYVDNAYGCMARADAFVLSSVHEGLPTVLLEALAVGTPIVSTDCPSGPREILVDGTYGPLVPVGDADALADAIVDTLATPPASGDLRARAADFATDAVLDRYGAFVEDLVSGSGSR